MKLLLTLLSLISINAAAAEVLSFPASYTVPVESEDLEGFNQFEISDYTVLNDGENSKISYTLPLALTGGELTEVSLALTEHIGSQRKFEGALGKAECQGPWAKMKCSTRFNLQLDPQKIEQFIRSQFPQESQEPVLRVALGFSTEPIGFSETLILAPQPADAE